MVKLSYNPMLLKLKQSCNVANEEVISLKREKHIESTETKYHHEMKSSMSARMMLVEYYLQKITLLFGIQFVMMQLLLKVHFKNMCQWFRINKGSRIYNY